MKLKRVLLPLLALMLCMTGCGGEKTNEESAESVAGTSAEVEETPAEVTEGETEEEIPPTNAAFPDADPNAVTFADGNFAFASIVADDDDSAQGELSIVQIDNNYMLKFTDTSTNADNLKTAVQKVKIDVTQLLTPDQIECVYSIGVDICAEATADLYVNEDGENTKAPGWIGGGAGTNTADGKWYDFAEFSDAGTTGYVLERSDFTRAEFKFILASAGKKWDASMDEVFVQIMRWGMGNASNLYIDNITFYDEEGNSIPLTITVPEEGGEASAEGETAAEEAAEATE